MKMHAQEYTAIASQGAVLFYDMRCALCTSLHCTRYMTSIARR